MSDFFYVVKYHAKPTAIMCGSAVKDEMTVEEAQQAKAELDFCLNEAGIK